MQYLGLRDESLEFRVSRLLGTVTKDARGFTRMAERVREYSRANRTNGEPGVRNEIRVGGRAAAL
jgi:hypothetical protein